MAKPIPIPICVSGSITKAGISFCLDQATHIIDTPIGATRLVPVNEFVKAKLDGYIDKKVIVTVCGLVIATVECFHIEVYSVEFPADFTEKMTSWRESGG